jgi:hypothetical protein
LASAIEEIRLPAEGSLTSFRRWSENTSLTRRRPSIVLRDPYFHGNPHKPAALYEAFEPAVARSLIERLEIHYTPKHGSWLNMAEIELSVLSRQCLDRRIPDVDTLISEVAAWEQARNTIPQPVNWRFTTPDARIKLKRLYPSIQDG